MTCDLSAPEPVAGPWAGKKGAPAAGRPPVRRTSTGRGPARPVGFPADAGQRRLPPRGTGGRHAGADPATRRRTRGPDRPGGGLPAADLRRCGQARPTPTGDEVRPNGWTGTTCTCGG